eukprot:TRINITY_DN7488_c0_g1_i1.p1 TRINITY_DN7488_c0_g1~~TRINITY_DN7488_c0_g1_i1.p1  ORF type:complete len:314 (-),score=46.17 TRINITY_DN7488_c0_g1_i1:314-1255(-)
MDQAQPPYRFGLQPAQPWLDHLQSEGYVVLANVASASDVQRARELIWKDIENMWSVSRTDPSTWNGFGVGLPGLCPNLAQAAGPWHLRGLQSVRHAFGCIWGSAEKPEEELLTSMDCVLLWRPWWKNAEWTPVTEGLHLDQNPFTKPDLECVQGMMPLIEVSEASGGLQVVPQSHRSENKSELQERYKHWEMRGDWCLLFDNDALQKEARLLLAQPGDLILWDSRTVHGGLVGHGRVEAEPTKPVLDLARMSVTICMTPKSWASEKVREKRKEGFKKGTCFNHVPHEAGSSSGTVHGQTPFVAKLTEEQSAVL